jgi:hypothetical protein
VGIFVSVCRVFRAIRPAHDQHCSRSTASLQEAVPVLDTEANRWLRRCISLLRDQGAYRPILYVVREDNQRMRPHFLQLLYDDRSDSGPSYVEYLQALAVRCCGSFPPGCRRADPGVQNRVNK